MSLERDGDAIAGTEQTLDWVDALERRIWQVSYQGPYAFVGYAW